MPKNLSLLTERLPASQYEPPPEDILEPSNMMLGALPQITEAQDDYVPVVKNFSPIANPNDVLSRQPPSIQEEHSRIGLRRDI